MIYHMKQKVFSLGEKYSVFDDIGNLAFYAEGEFLSLKNKVHVYDKNKHEIAFIKKELLSFLPTYYADIFNFGIITIKKKFTLFTIKLTVEEMGLVLEGDFTSHNFTLKKDEREIMTVKKGWFTWGDSYDINIKDEQYTILCICVLLAVDLIIADTSAASNSSN